MTSQNGQNIAKAAAGQKAAALIEDGMLVGLGSGSTSACFIAALAERCHKGLNIRAVATSRASTEQASAAGIPLIDVNEVVELDMAVDGADEIDAQMRMIKGGGGALLREKIIAGMSREMVVIIDWTKQVERLGNAPLPIEIVPFGYNALIYKLEHSGYRGELRKTRNGQLYLTDNDHYIYDLHIEGKYEDPLSIETELKAIPGVIETGFFLNFAKRVIIGYADGHTEEKNAI